MSTDLYDVAIIGGGIVGMATALALTRRRSQKIVVLEAENHLAAHQTGNNSGVIHSGLYYKPGSLKALNCVRGREAMYQFCEKYNIPHERTGKVVVATRYSELPALDQLEERGHANGLEGLRRLDHEGIKRYEPRAAGFAGLFVPQTGIVDYVAVTNQMAQLVMEAGGEICTGARVRAFRKGAGENILMTPRGEIRARNLINCAGLQSDRVAKMCGVNPHLQIVPFRGEYYTLDRSKLHLVRNLIYPVPDTRFPFLGVHFTRMIHGGVEIGPNAVIAFRREGYKLSQVDLRDMAQYGFYLGLWRMASKYWRMGMAEFYRSLVKKALVREVQRLVPEISGEDMIRAGAGVRAQALESNGLLVDDFRIVQSEHMIHVLNAPSPAATASLSIGETIADMAEKAF